jgi:hypothetical protein
LVVVVQLAKLGFPALHLLLHLQAHCAPRYIVVDGLVGLPITPSRSVLAGSNSSGDIARGYLYAILQLVHDSFRPVELGLHVDDLNLLAIGRQEEVIVQATGATLMVNDLLGSIRLQLADKSTVVASTKAVADEVVDALALRGLSLKSACCGRDLGVDFTAGARRRIPIVKARQLAGARRANRSRVIHAVLKKGRKWRAKRLWQGGIALVMQYGMASGVAPADVARMRPIALKSMDCSGSHQCTTAVFGVSLGRYRDPAVVVPCGRAESLPVGIQVMGTRFSDLRCLSVAEMIESAQPEITPIDPDGL